MKRLVAALAMAAIIGSAGAALAEKWDMPLAYPATNFHSETAVKFAEMVKQGTGGKIEIVTHPNGSLFKGDQIFRAVRTGQAPIGERLVSALENEDPLFGIDGLPFLATSYDEARKLSKAARPALEKLCESKGVVYLYSVAWPPQGLYTKKAINSAADMKNVKFRAYNAATSRLAELMGAIPTKIEAAEISQAFATGVAESMVSSGSTGYDMKIWQHVGFWYDAQAWLPKNMVVINKKLWDGLDGKTKAVIKDAAAKAEDIGWKESERLNNWYKDELRKNGMTVAAPSAQLKADFQAIGRTMTEEWLKKAGASGKAVVEAYRKM